MIHQKNIKAASKVRDGNSFHFQKKKEEEEEEEEEGEHWEAWSTQSGFRQISSSPNEKARRRTGTRLGLDQEALNIEKERDREKEIRKTNVQWRSETWLKWSIGNQWGCEAICATLSIRVGVRSFYGRCWWPKFLFIGRYAKFLFLTLYIYIFLLFLIFFFHPYKFFFYKKLGEGPSPFPRSLLSIYSQAHELRGHLWKKKKVSTCTTKFII